MNVTCKRVQLLDRDPECNLDCYLDRDLNNFCSLLSFFIFLVRLHCYSHQLIVMCMLIDIFAFITPLVIDIIYAQRTRTDFLSQEKKNRSMCADFCFHRTFPSDSLSTIKIQIMSAYSSLIKIGVT